MDSKSADRLGDALENFGAALMYGMIALAVAIAFASCALTNGGFPKVTVTMKQDCPHAK